MLKKEFIKESLHSLKEEGLLAMLKQTRSVITSYDRNGFDVEYIPNNGSGFVFLSNRIDNYKDVKDRYIQAFKIDCNDTEFSFRNRGEKNDIITKAVVFTPFKPFVLYDELDLNNDFNYYIKLNCNYLSIGLKSDIKLYDLDYYTLTYGCIAKQLLIDLNTYSRNLKSNVLCYRNTNDKVAPIPTIGIGKNGNQLGGYAGSKVIICNAYNYSNPIIVYGSANIIIEEFNNYLRKYNLNNALLLQSDGKKFSQSIQLYSKFIPKEFLTSRHWDNANSAKSGAGNILYIKNE